MGKKRWGLSVGAGRTGFAVPQIGHPQIFVCGIDERDERGRPVEAETRLLVVRATTAAATDGKIIHDRLDLLVGAAGQRVDSARKQLEHVSRDGVVKGGDAAREEVADELGCGRGRRGRRDEFVQPLLDDDWEVVRGVLYGGISEVALGNPLIHQKKTINGPHARSFRFF